MLHAIAAALLMLPAAARAGQLTPEQAAALQADESKMKAEAQQAYSALAGDLQKLQANPGAGLTPQQMAAFQGQATQALSSLTNNPQAMAAASQNGVSAQQLQQLQTQTQAAFQNLKGSQNPAVANDAAQLQQALDSPQAQQLKADAHQAAQNLSADQGLRQDVTQGEARVQQAAPHLGQALNDLGSPTGGLKAAASDLGVTAQDGALVKDGVQRAAGDLGVTPQSVAAFRTKVEAAAAQLEADPQLAKLSGAAVARLCGQILAFNKKHAADGTKLVKVPAACLKDAAAGGTQQ